MMNPILRMAIEQSFELADIDAEFFPDAGSPCSLSGEWCYMYPSLTFSTWVYLGAIFSYLMHKDKELPVVWSQAGDISMAVQAIKTVPMISLWFANERNRATKRAIDKRQLTLENLELKRNSRPVKALGPRIIGDTQSMTELRLSSLMWQTPTLTFYANWNWHGQRVGRTVPAWTKQPWEQNFVAVRYGAVPERTWLKANSMDMKKEARLLEQKANVCR